MYEPAAPASYAAVTMAQLNCKAALRFRNDGKNLEAQTQDSQLNLIMVSPVNNANAPPLSQKISRCPKSMQIPAKWMQIPVSLLFHPPGAVRPLDRNIWTLQNIKGRVLVISTKNCMEKS